MTTRAFVCLITHATDQAPTAIAVCASDRASALVRGREAAEARGGSEPAGITAILTQEDVTSLGMLLAAARVTLATGLLETETNPTNG